MTTEQIRAALEARKRELADEAEKIIAPYRAALGEVERMLQMLEDKE